MTRDECLAHASNYFNTGEFLNDLQRRVAFATVSDRPPLPPALHTYLREEIVPSLSALGFSCEVIENAVAGAPPMLIAKRFEGHHLATVMTYGHGDVVSGQDEKWRSGLAPWKIVQEGDKWYGRGTADNKGQHTINLAGLAAAIKARDGQLGYNMTVLLEMGEEAGSPGLHETCKAHADKLKANVFIASDGPRLNASSPTVFLGSRGAINFTLQLRARERAYHSGNWGGVLLNPGVVIAHAVACLVDARGKVLVPELRPERMDRAAQRVLADVEIGKDPGDPALEANWGEPGLSAAERLMAWNTIEVLALGAGTPERPINAIPGSAQAHCQLRFVVGTPWQDLKGIIERHLAKHGFENIEVIQGMTGAASKLDADDPWVQWLCDSMQKSVHKNPVVLPCLAGTLPNDVFTDTLGLPTLWIPHSYPACAQHAPNEHLLPEVALEGLKIMAGVYWDLGEPAGKAASAPWRI